MSWVVLGFGLVTFMVIAAAAGRGGGKQGGDAEDGNSSKESAERENPQARDGDALIPDSKDSAPASKPVQIGAERILKDLKGRSWWSRWRASGRALEINRQGQSLLKSGREVMEEDAQRLKSFLKDRKDIRQLEDEHDLLELEKERRKAEIEAEIEERRLRTTEARIKTDLLKNPPSPPLAAQPLTTKEKLAKELEQALTKSRAYEELRREWKSKYPDDTRIQEDIDGIIEQKKEKDALK